MSRSPLFLPVVVLAALAALAASARAGLPVVSIQEARVVEGNAGATHLEFEVVASGPPRRLALAYSLTDVTASAAAGDYSPAGGVVSLTPSPARLIGHWGAGTLLIPGGVALAPNGDVIAVDGPSARVIRFSSDGTWLATFGEEGDGLGQLHHPEGVAVNAHGDIYVANIDNRVNKYIASGQFIHSWGSSGSLAGQFDMPGGIAVDAAGFVYVSDVGNNRIQKFTDYGVFVTMWSTALAGEPAQDGPLGIAVDALGNVYVAKGRSGRIYKYAPDGSLVATWNDTKGSCAGYGLHVDDAGNVLIADAENSRIVVLDDQGAFLTEWSLDEGPEHNPNEFGAMTVVSDHEGNIYVGSRHASSIAHFRWDRAVGSIEVPVTGDAAFEADETLELTLSESPDATLADATAIGTIVNDDLELGANQAANGHFESTLEGWSAYSGATLELSPDGIDASYSVRALGTGVSTFGLNDSPDVVPSTVADARYQYSAWVRSGGTGSARLRVREYLAGELQATSHSAPIAFDGSWQRLELPVRAHTTGATLDFQVIGSFAATDQEFLIDDAAVRALGVDVPPVLEVAADADGSWMRDVVVEVSAHDPEGEPIDALEADLSGLHGASFVVAPDHTHGTLRWHPVFEDVRDKPHLVTFIAKNAANTSATTRIRIVPNVVLNESFETALEGWSGHVDATLARVPGGRRDAFAARLTLPSVDWAGLNDSPNSAAPAGEGRRFIFGAWVRSESGQGNVRIQVREYQAGVLLGKSSRESPGYDGPLTSNWRRIMISHTCIATGASELDLTIDAQGAAGGTFDVDDVSIIGAAIEQSVSVPTNPPPTLAARVFPNPARGRAILELTVPTSGPLRVEFYDLAGRRRALVADEARAEPGVRRFVLAAPDGRLGPGLYWYRASMASGVRQGRFVLIE